MYRVGMCRRDGRRARIVVAFALIGGVVGVVAAARPSVAAETTVQLAQAAPVPIPVSSSSSAAVAPTQAAAPAPVARPVASKDAPTGGGPVARGASLGGDANRTRFMADLSQHVQISVFTLSDPYRVIVELPQVAFQMPQGLGSQGQGLVRAYRYGLFAPGKSRIVLDVTGPVLVESSSVSQPKAGEPARLSIDLVPTDRATFMAGQSRQLVASGTAVLSKLGRPPLTREARKPVVVIDPGHGGHDSGATKNGAVEKEVVLAFSKVLREKLLATGAYEVLMTRDTDTFVDLDARREFAKRHNAALFLAIHADYVPSGSHVRGATIYTLRESMANSMARSLDKSGLGDVLAGVELDRVRQIEDSPDTLKRILTDLAEREQKPTKSKTAFFAKNVIASMGETTELKAEPHREAAFRVLKSAEVPSVLIELAYVSNKQDAENLKSNEWRNRVSASIVTAVQRYFNMTRLPL